MLNLKIDDIKNKFEAEIAKHLADLESSLQSIDDGTYAISRGRPTGFGSIRIDYSNLDILSEAPQRNINKCFLVMMADFVSFLDTIIAVKQMLKNGVVVTKTIKKDELIKYVQNKLEQNINKVSKLKLNNIEKLKTVGGLTPATQRAIEGYFALRRSLEHRRNRLDNDTKLTTIGVIKLFDGKTEMEPGHVMRGGSIIEARLENRERILSKGSKVDISEDEIRGIVIMLRRAAHEIIKPLYSK